MKKKLSNNNSSDSSPSVTDTQYQDLQEAFDIFAQPGTTPGSNTLTTVQKLQSAMKALGLQLSIKEVQVMKDEYFESCLRRRRLGGRNVGRQKVSTPKKSNNSNKNTKDSAKGGGDVGQRSMRTRGVRQSYKENDDDTEDDDDDDAYKSDGDQEEEEQEDSDTDMQVDEDDDDDDQDSENRSNKEIQFSDFVTIMAPFMIEEQQQQEVATVFELFKHNKDYESTRGGGKEGITVQDLKRIAKELGLTNIKDQEFRDMIEQGDRDGDGVVDLQEFTKIMQRAGFH